MRPVRARTSVPRYPALVAAAALGAALATASGCGPGEDLDPGHLVQSIVQAKPDGGAQPQPNDFVGGAAPYEALLPDGGVP